MSGLPGLAPLALFDLAWSMDDVSALIEIGLLTWLFYVILKFLHGTRGLAVMKGVGIIVLLIVGMLMVLGWTFGLSFPRLDSAGSVLLPFLAVVLVILFQPELRTGLTRFSVRGGLGREEVDTDLADFTTSVARLARRQVGLLVVFELQIGLRNIEASGVALDAALSGPLIENIFHPKAPLHDGAVLVRGGRLVAASCMLPLVDADGISRDLGTRHRAALGVSEETDAVVVVVSEETGQISVARRGMLHPVDGAEELLVTLVDSLEGAAPASKAA